MKKKLLLLFIIFLLSIVLCGCAADHKKILNGVADLNKKNVRVITSEGSAFGVAADNAFPNAKQIYVDDIDESINKVIKEKADAFVTERTAINKAFIKNSEYSDQMVTLEEVIGTTQIAVGLQKGDTALKKLFDDFIKQQKANGVLEDMNNRWCVEEFDELPVIEEPADPDKSFVIATCGSFPPFTYVNNNGELSGYDIELIKRFALYANADVKIIIMNFSEIVDALENKFIDAAVSNLQITEERKAIIDYSIPYDENDIVVCVRKDRIEEETRTFGCVSDLNDPSISLIVETGTASALAAKENLPEANLIYGARSADCFVSVLEGKTAGFAVEKPVYDKALKANTSLAQNMTVAAGNLGEVDIAIGLPENSGDIKLLCDNFITQLRSDGTLDDMIRRWMTEDSRTMPDIPEPEAPQREYSIGTCGFLEPWSYTVDNGELNGFDIELIKRFALYANAEINIQTMDFDALIASLQSGKLDAVISDLNITEERDKYIDYSIPYYVSPILVCINRRNFDLAGESIKSLDLSLLDGKNIGVPSNLRSEIKNSFSETYPNGTVKTYDEPQNMINELKKYGLDAVCMSETEINNLDDPELTAVDEAVFSEQRAFCIDPEKSRLKKDMDLLIEKYISDQTLDDLKEKWMGSDSVSQKDVDIAADHSAENGILNVYTTAKETGYSFINDNGNLAGYDIELIMKIAKELGYVCTFTIAKEDELSNALQSGAADICIGIDPSRKNENDQLLFTEATGENVFKMVLYDPIVKSRNQLFAEKVKESFRSTFIEEERWKMILRSLLTTVEITFFSVVFGTILGILFSTALRSRKKPVSFFAHEISNLLNATPLVVILMVLYYIIFADASIAPLIIAIIGFSLDFANTVAGLFNTGLKAIGSGQIEAAQTLGLSRWVIFSRILLPQASRQMFDSYRAGIINLIKGTAIVGYITIEDLTKVSDIIRSRTYEAFFPLITTALIYIILARIVILLLDFLLDLVEKGKQKRILKGVTR